MIDEQELAEKFEALAPFLGETGRRMWAATEARSIGRGGVASVHRATGIAKSTIYRGLNDLDSGDAEFLAHQGRTRRKGAGRKSLTEYQPGLYDALDQLIDPQTRGDPCSLLRWTSKSTEKLAEELCHQGFTVSPDTVGRMLRETGYSLQSNRKRLEGTTHEDRDDQFQKIANLSKSMQRQGAVVISVDTKKKELVGLFANKGREWRPKGDPESVNVHDFPSTGDGRAVPYGIYDVGRNEGFVSVGISKDTSEFAVSTIRKWWNRLGRRHYRKAGILFITADCGGSNGYRIRLWKAELQRFADDTGMRVRVAHYPPGTSKWNKIEHRLFSQITANWRGRPLTTYQVVVDLIGATTTKTGLKVYAYLDDHVSEKGRDVTDEEMSSLKIKRDPFHGEWNYTILPHKQK
ncbi:MAG: ISAzo13 family transposase [Deltaproteobacteria bacterium]|nr:ISAzo13 family transposase [Deltaproteobacteria bacterium]